MVANGGNAEGLFRGAFMQSGSPIPVGDISHGQPDYDALVSKTGCTGAADTLNCLRQVPFATLKTAVDASPGIFSPQVRFLCGCIEDVDELTIVLVFAAGMAAPCRWHVPGRRPAKPGAGW